jgi:transglutaminase-like putative cysteine protease
MTAQTIARSRIRPFAGGLQLRPAEGWLTLVMVMLLVVTLAWSLQDAAWVPVGQGSTDYLFWLALGGVGIEFIGAKAGLGRWRTHLVGVLVAGLVLPFVAGAAVLGAGRQPVDFANPLPIYQAAGSVAYHVWADLIRDSRPFTSQYGHYHIVFGAFVWAAGMLAAGAVFSRRRPHDAVFVVGLLLLANMAITEHEQLQYLVVFSVAALSLLVRSHTFDEQVTWVRRRIGDPQAVSALYLRGGGSFVGVAVIAALFLTATASSAPLQGFWADVPQRLAGLTQWIQRIAPTGGNPRGLGTVGFGPTATTQGLWEPTNAVAFTAQVPPGELAQFKWRAGTYATYDGIARWDWGDTASLRREAGAPLLAKTGDDPAVETGRREIRLKVTPDAFRDVTIVSPQAIESVDRPTILRLTTNRFTSVEWTEGSGSYNVTALIPVIGGADGLTENRLRVAGRSYPADVVRSYLGVPDGSLGPQSLAIYDDVKRIAGEAGGPAGNAYDFALALQNYLRSSQFQYSNDVRDLVREHCSGLSSAECFATIRKGYCEYYATLMTLLLRHDGIPARIVYGFLGGTRQADGTEVVTGAAQHWWVEDYFPGHGWVEFDPTGGDIGRPQAIPSGPPETPRASLPAPSFRGDERETDPLNGASGRPNSLGANGQGPIGPGPFIAIAILLLIGVGALAFAARRRGPRRPMDPDVAWGSLGRLAARFGFGPRPAQTVYEYAGMLGEAVPTARVELSTVARAKVEVAYGRHELGVDRLRAVGEAYRRLRFALLRVWLRRLPRRRR